ncbi:MAG TPA: Uma2 family endonuclease [Vicinamibacteria bacterium]
MTRERSRTRMPLSMAPMVPRGPGPVKPRVRCGSDAIRLDAPRLSLPADGRRHEPHEGKLSVTPAPVPRHQRVSHRLLRALDRHVEADRLGEVFHAPLDLILSDTSVVQPDLLYLDPPRMTSITERGIEGPPALVIEILSPSTAPIDRGVKLGLYARHGAPCYWIVDADARLIEAHVLAGDAYRLAATLEGGEPRALPPFRDLRLDPAAIWV